MSDQPPSGSRAAESMPPSRGRYRLGVFGGMFDPPHVGHVAVVRAAVAGAALDRCLVVPSGRPPHRSLPRASGAQRLAMTFAAFADIEQAAPSDIELQRADDGIPTYMIDTLDELAAQPAELGYSALQLQLVLVIGADHVASFSTWHRWREILAMAELAVVRRPALVGDAQLAADITHLRDEAGARITMCDMAEVDASSKAVRRAAREHDTVTLSRMLPTTMVRQVLAEYGASAVPRR